MKHKSDEPELQPLLTNESLIGVGNPSRSTGGSVVLDLTEQAKKHQLGSGAWIINEPEPSERNYTETYNISERLKSHPTFIGYQKKAKYTCIKPELIVSLPILCVIMIVVFLNLVVLLIYPFDDDVDFGAGTIQQWIVIIDIAAVELLVVWGIAKGIHLLLKFLVSASFLPAIEFILIQWNLYELAITGLIWGIICGMTWKPYTHNSADGSVSEDMIQIMHDLIIADILFFASLALKVFITTALESYLYKDFSPVIALSLREERDLMRLEERLFRDPNDRLLSKKFQEMPIQPFVHHTFRKVISAHRTSEKPDHIATHVAASNFAQTLVERYGRSGYLTKQDFCNISPKFRSLLASIFEYLDTDRDGKVGLVDINMSLRDMFTVRQELRKKMRSKKVLVDITNTMLNTLLFITTIIVILTYILEISFSEWAIPVATLILACSFAYQSLLEDIVNNIYTLFVVRPYNIGDLISVNGEKYYVEEVGILCTACVSEDGYIAYISNALMRQQPLINLKRGLWIRLKFTCYILPATTINQIREFREQLTFFCVQSQIFSSKAQVYTDDTLNPGPVLIARLKLKGYANWQNKKQWQDAQTKAIMAITNIATELGILDTRNKLHVESHSIV